MPRPIVAFDRWKQDDSGRRLWLGMTYLATFSWCDEITKKNIVKRNSLQNCHRGMYHVKLVMCYVVINYVWHKKQTNTTCIKKYFYFNNSNRHLYWDEFSQLSVERGPRGNSVNRGHLAAKKAGPNVSAANWFPRFIGARYIETWLYYDSNKIILEHST